MTCGTCQHWRLAGDLSAHGFGTCAVRPSLVLGASIATSAQAPCRIGKFVPLALPKEGSLL